MARQQSGVRAGSSDHIGSDPRRLDLPDALRQALAWGVKAAHAALDWAARRPRRCLLCANVTAAVVGVLIGWFG